MITCTLGEKKYTVDYITGRALREMEPAAKMYAKIVAVANAATKGETVPEEQQFTIPEAMDVMIRWFCLLFGTVSPLVAALATATIFAYIFAAGSISRSARPVM